MAVSWAIAQFKSPLLIHEPNSKTIVLTWTVAKDRFVDSPETGFPYFDDDDHAQAPDRSFQLRFHGDSLEVSTCSSSAPNRHVYACKLSIMCSDGTEEWASVTGLMMPLRSKFYKNTVLRLGRENLSAARDRILVDGKLTVQVKMTQMDYLLEPQKPRDAINLAEQLETPEPSDVTCELIVAGVSHEFPLHKAILLAESPALAAALFTEAAPGSQRCQLIENISLEAFQVVLRFIYTGKVAETDLEQYCTELFVFADKYQMDPLRQLCAHLFEMCAALMKFKVNVSSAFSLRELAERHRLTGLAQECEAFINANLCKFISNSKFK